VGHDLRQKKERERQGGKERMEGRLGGKDRRRERVFVRVRGGEMQVAGLASATLGPKIKKVRQTE
jgi:hypothetical protein